MTTLFPEVEVHANAADMEMKLQTSSEGWIIAVKYTGPGENCGTSKQATITSKQAGAVMALFIASDGMEELEQPLYDIIGTDLGEVTGDWSPIP